MNIRSIFRTVKFEPDAEPIVDGFLIPTYNSKSRSKDILHLLIAAGVDGKLQEGQEAYVFGKESFSEQDWSLIQEFLPNCGLEKNDDLIIGIKDDKKSFVRVHHGDLFGIAVLRDDLVSLN